MSRRLHRSHYGSHLHRRLSNAITLQERQSLRGFVEGPLSEFSSSFIKRGSTDSTGAKPSDSNNVTLPVALAVVIPVVFAIVIFFYLHRRHVKKLRVEDANDPHKSLDFGWEPKGAPLKGRNKSRKKGPEMAIANLGPENGIRRERGLSMDLDLPSPYLLPPGLSGSRESLHSISRTIHSQDDRYRPATTYNPNDVRPLHSNIAGRRGADDSSSDAGASSFKPGLRDDMKQDLLGNAQRMSRSMPPTNRSPVPDIRVPEATKAPPLKSTPPNPHSTGLSPSFPLIDSRDSYMSKDDADLRKSNNYLGALIHSRDPSADLNSQQGGAATPIELPTSPPSNLQQNSNHKPAPPAIAATEQKIISKSPPPVNSTHTASRLPRGQSLRASEQGTYDNFFDDSSEYGDGVKATTPSPHRLQIEHQEAPQGSSQSYMPQIDESTPRAVHADDVGYDVRRLSMSVRPLPPDDPTDNPEQRANRIRSFYKEYFDDSKPGPVHAAAGYYEDYDQQYLGDGAIFDPVSGQFVTQRPSQPQYPEQRGRPYAEPVTRRAMTPPPRAPLPRSGRQHAATLSGGGRMIPPGPRAFSSASGRLGASGRGLPKKQAPPPLPLNVLPTPHMLKDDNFAIFNSMDFAPPTSAKDRQAGRPESPRGGFRPYSPAVSAHMPLQSSFDDLAPMPSP